MKDIRTPDPFEGRMPGSLLSLLLQTAGLYQERIEEELRGIGLSRTLYITLEQLAIAGGPLTQRELAIEQRCAPSNITQKIDRLEKGKLVRRLADPSDRRSILAELTPLGARRTSAAAEIVRRIEAEFESLLDGKDRAALEKILGRFRST